MKKYQFYALITSILLFCSTTLYAQKQINVSNPSYFSISQPLKDLPPHIIPLNNIKALPNEGTTIISEKKQVIKSQDPVKQSIMGKSNPLRSAGLIQNFRGQNSMAYPPDCNGAAGPNHYMQTVNMTYSIYDKQGNQLIPPTDLNTMFYGLTGIPDANLPNDGDPLILYDEQADRWIMTEFKKTGYPNYMFIAVSVTNDPTGQWYRWAYEMTGIPDYPKLGIWRDGYYMGTNTSNEFDIHVFNREAMLTGDSNAQMIQFQNLQKPKPAGLSVKLVMPLDNDGPFAPIGTPGMFIAFNDDTWNGGFGDELWIYECSVDWITPQNSSFTRTQQIPVAAFNSSFSGFGYDLKQPTTTKKLHAVSSTLMYRAQYRNFGDHQTIVCAHTVDADGNKHAGIRWYELEKTTSTWTIRQQSTYAPDAADRWMPSIAMNGKKEIALGYSIVDSTNNIFPGIRYCGQSASENAIASGNLDLAEQVILQGQNAQTYANRWGDYSMMCLDPNDDFTFWFSSQYIINTTTVPTQIAAFTLSTPDYPQNIAAIPISDTQIDVSWTLNPNNDPVLLLVSTNQNFGTPQNGVAYSAGQNLPGGGTVIFSGSATNFSNLNLSPNTLYYYKIVSNLGGTNSYSTNNPFYVFARTNCGVVGNLPWYENFENDTTNFNCLVQTKNIGTQYWKYTTGNQGNNPAQAHSGITNALIKDTNTSDDITLLELPTFDFTGHNAMQLSFWHTQEHLFSFQDKLRVLYKNSASAQWTELANFTQSTPQWTEEILQLPNLSTDYHIAFEGNAKGGRGICIDDIAIDYMTNISAQPNPKLEISPNPAKDFITIRTNRSIENAEIKISRITGETVYRKSNAFLYNTKIDISKFPAGMYLLKIKANNKTTVQKIIFSK